MDAISKAHKRERNDMFRAIAFAKRFLTKKYHSDEFMNWVKMMKTLNDALQGDERNVVCKVMAIIYFKYEDEVIATVKQDIEKILKKIGIDETIFYDYYHDANMRKEALESRDVEIMEEMIKSLSVIAKDTEVDPRVRIQAWKQITQHINDLAKAAGRRPIHVKADNVAIDASTGKQVGAGSGFDLGRLIGQGDKEFRSKIKELDEIRKMETIDQNGNIDNDDK